MYGDSAEVRALVVNVEPLQQSEIDAALHYADSVINGKLSRIYKLPLVADLDGNYPDPIPVIASHLAASLLESRKFSVTSVGAISNPYAQELKETAMQLLEEVVRVNVVLSGQQLLAVVPTTSSAPETRPDGSEWFRTVRQLRSTGSS